MPKQLSFEHTNPGRVLGLCRSFVDSEYAFREANADHPPIRNRHEAFGHLAEAATQAAAAAKNITRALDDALHALPAANDNPFVDAAQTAYSSALDTVALAAQVAVCAMNVTSQLIALPQNNEPTPLEEAAGLPDIDAAALEDTGGDGVNCTEGVDDEA